MNANAVDGNFVVEVVISKPIDELMSRSEAYREAQLESMALAGVCYRQYLASDVSGLTKFACDWSREQSSSMHNFWMESSVLCADSSQLWVQSKLGLQIR